MKATSEFHLDYGSHMGAFVRASYFYDFENANNDKLTQLAQDQVGDRLRILDAFVYDNFTLNNQQGSVRFGKQVLSWGSAHCSAVCMRSPLKTASSPRERTRSATCPGVWPGVGLSRMWSSTA